MQTALRHWVRQPERGARLLGASEALREEIGSVLEPEDQAEYDRDMSIVRGQLELAEELTNRPTERVRLEGGGRFPAEKKTRS